MESRFTRESLFAQLHADLDDLLDRVEPLPKKIAAVETSLQASTKALLAGGDKYRAAVLAMNEEAKAHLTQYMRLEAGKAATAMTAELAEAASTAFRAEASEQSAAVKNALAQAAEVFGRSRRSRLGELVLACGLTAVTTALATVGLSFVILRGLHLL